MIPSDITTHCCVLCNPRCSKRSSFENHSCRFFSLVWTCGNEPYVAWISKIIGTSMSVKKYRCIHFDPRLWLNHIFKKFWCAIYICPNFSSLKNSHTSIDPLAYMSMLPYYWKNFPYRRIMITTYLTNSDNRYNTNEHRYSGLSVNLPSYCL